jgi:hypothetical protein
MKGHDAMIFDPNMSDVTIVGFSAERLGAFLRWQRSFDKRSRVSPLVDQRLRALAAQGCLFCDLWWGLYWIAAGLECASIMARQFTAFRNKLETLVEDLEQIETRLKTLMKMQGPGGTLPGMLARFCQATERDAAFVTESPSDLSLLRGRLLCWLEIVKERQALSVGATVSEVLFLLYVEVATQRKPNMQVTSALMEAGCEAYGVEGRDYSYEAVSKRYYRFKQSHPDEVVTIRRSIEQVFRLRKRGVWVDVFPFFVKHYRASAPNSMAEEWTECTKSWSRDINAKIFQEVLVAQAEGLVRMDRQGTQMPFTPAVKDRPA